MNITLNNRPETFDSDELSINELLRIRNFTFKMLVIKVNGTLVGKDRYDHQKVTEGDDVMILHLISGG